MQRSLLERPLQHVLPARRDVQSGVLVRQLLARVRAGGDLLVHGLLGGVVHVYGTGVPVAMESVPRPSPLEPGYRIDRYELLYVHAQGGMGTVWVARLQGKHGFEKLYAIKTILPKYAEDDAFRTMFLDEARIASAIDHPNIAQILDLGEQHGILYQVLEYVEGESIQRMLRIAEKAGETMPLEIAMRLVADTCAGLHAAHELVDDMRRPRDVVHRDVNPHNVLVSVGGVAKLIDFGIAKARNRLAGETSEGVLKGKIRYICPEQALGMEVDRRADVWSAAAMLRVLVGAGPPFPGSTDMDVLRALLSDAPPAPLPDALPEPVARVLECGLKRNRDERFATAIKMQEAIERALTEMAISCPPAAVGAWVRRLTPSRIEGRREALELATRAAEQRARVREVLERPLAGNAPYGTSSRRSPRTGVGSMDTPLAAASADSVPVNASQTSITHPEGVPRHDRARTIGGAVVGSLALLGLVALYVNRAGDRHERTATLPGTSAAAPAQPLQTSPIAEAVPQDPPPAAPSASPGPVSEGDTGPNPAGSSAAASGTAVTKRAVSRSKANSGSGRAAASPAGPGAMDGLGGTIDSRK